MDESIHQHSLQLWNILERVGISERRRKFCRETCIREEILDTLTNTMTDKDISAYIFGSFSECTATAGMGSDVDCVVCLETLPVIEDIQQAPAGESLLTVSDNHTRPGYVKLQAVLNGIPLTVNNRKLIEAHSAYDHAGRVCVKEMCVTDPLVNEHNGPAHSVSKHAGHQDIDIVPAVRAKTFPRVALATLQECVRSGWLTGDQVEEMINFKCLFVRVGHPASDEKELEWRISFSLQERQLMFHLNPTQHKCYSVLKLLKCMLTSELAGKKSITSYHVKSCLFSVIVKVGLAQWKPENLINCTFTCLHELLQRLNSGNCPNFFIKSNNMFEQRIDEDEATRLAVFIHNLIQEGYKAFYRIQSDNIGNMLRRNVSRCFESELQLDIRTYKMYFITCAHQLYNQWQLYAFTNRISKNDVARYLFKQICYLESVKKITEHSEDETKSAASVLIPGLHKLYAQHEATLAFETNVSEDRQHLLQASARHLKQGMAWDLMSGKLLQATILYRQGNIDLCCDLLEQIERSLDRTITSLCSCQSHRRPFQVNKYLLRHIVQSGYPDLQSIMQSSVAPCITFLPYQREIIPAAVQYELYRSVFSLPGTRDDQADKWFDWAVVDSKVYLYLMQYIVYRDLNKPGPASLAYQSLLRVLMEDDNLKHRETGYNLLGWIYAQEERVHAAAHCFLQSWRIRPHHNAAKWHVLNIYARNHVVKQ